MFTKQLALISETNQVSLSEVTRISAALQKQITRDFSPIWNLNASIDAFEKLEDVPGGYWPIIIRDDTGYQGAAGIHLDQNGQPFALVQASEGTPMTCSHECLEMLADPFGSRFVTSNSIKPDQGRVNYLLEVCDSSEAEAFGYSVNGILLSDFYTPNFFDPVASPAIRYSFTSAIKKPLEILKGGYISWMIPETREWWQATYFGDSITFRSLGVLDRKNNQSWRETIDALTFEPVKKIIDGRPKTNLTAFVARTTTSSSNAWAKNLHAQIEGIVTAKGK